LPVCLLPDRKRFISFTDAKKFTGFYTVFFKKFIFIQLFNA